MQESLLNGNVQESLLNGESHRVRPVWPLELPKQPSVTGLACWLYPIRAVKKKPEINQKQDHEKENYPLECIFSNMETASIAIHDTISADILKPQNRKYS